MPERDEVRDLLTEAAALFPTGEAPLAQLGARLRELDPAFSSQRHGAGGLRELLEARHDLGAVERGLTEGAWLFRFATGAQSVTRVLHKIVWDAVTEPRPSARRLFDLATRRLITPIEAASANEPERFLEFPCADDAFQRQLAQQTAIELGAVKEIEAALEQPDWFAAIGRAFDGVGARDEWRKRRRSAIVKLVEDWSAKHGISTEEFFASRRSRGESTVAANGDLRARRPNVEYEERRYEQELRALIRDAADVLTVEELLELRLPVRLMLRRR